MNGLGLPHENCSSRLSPGPLCFLGIHVSYAPTLPPLFFAFLPFAMFRPSPTCNIKYYTHIDVTCGSHAQTLAYDNMHTHTRLDKSICSACHLSRLSIAGMHAC
ncbi:hypothetical protein IE81DRAFT_51898 [Ceraceosorus guamensis]|uniref:Uncharacterized protein n=1 Tax=Ceraceosorus guamensis TaxID=1522189 RepID=A0A316W216_9BASI|nr:hypothetical protein IE81DRAFT_51898 [Ceraceosorus guamensis]PWN43906.1 hypothetical protein IE81DRAFT_51898 [Ceraceosorus guamensis]